MKRYSKRLENACLVRLFHTMTFLWPGFLVGLGLIPLLICVYWWVQRRPRRTALRYSSLALVRAARPGPAGLRKHIPPALFLLALASLSLSLARPVLVRLIPVRLTTIILAIDVSDSMLLDDIKPNRLLAAENAALSFMYNQRGKAQIGIVAFATDAYLVLPPSTDPTVLKYAIHSLTTGTATAIGSGIITSVASIDRANPGFYQMRLGKGRKKLLSTKEYSPDYIVVLTDGVNTMGPSPFSAARVTALQGVRIFTIGFGTRQGPSEQNGPLSKQTPSKYLIDEKSLQEISAISGGKYYSAESAHELEKVFVSLPTNSVVRSDLQEMSVVFVTFGALFAAMAMILSILWSPFP